MGALPNEAMMFPCGGWGKKKCFFPPKLGHDPLNIHLHLSDLISILAETRRDRCAERAGGSQAGETKLIQRQVCIGRIKVAPAIYREERRPRKVDEVDVKGNRSTVEGVVECPAPGSRV